MSGALKEVRNRIKSVQEYTADYSFAENGSHVHLSHTASMSPQEC
jgi:hypothetical protein